ncbi:MAG: hypothetical protein LUD76_06850 [Alistipes sp.]|nr:hypothetical protein [Alistipes sp.]
MKTFSITKYAAMAAVAMAALSCKVEEGTGSWTQDKNYTLAMDVNTVVDDCFTIARAGFAAVCYDGATEEEKIIYENSVLKGYKFRKLEKRWSVDHHERSCYIEIAYGPEGEPNEIKILRSTKYDYEDTAPFDSCKLVNLGEDVWELRVKNAVTHQPSYSYRDGSASFIFETGEWTYYPASMSVSGKGTYTSHLAYQPESNPVEVEWELSDGTVVNTDPYYMSDLRQGVLDITAGPQGAEKESVRVRFDWDKVEWEAVER